MFLPLGGKVRMRDESEQVKLYFPLDVVQLIPSPWGEGKGEGLILASIAIPLSLGEGEGERVWYNQYLQEILRVDLFSSIQKSDLYTPQNDVACLFPLQWERGQGRGFDVINICRRFFGWICLDVFNNSICTPLRMTD